MGHPIEFNGKKLIAWKTNLHGHTTVSDGWLKPEEAIARYAQLGYDAMNFSDHKKPNPVNAYDGLGMTLISGIELHPLGPRNILWHLLAIDVPCDFHGEYETAEAAIRAVHAVGGIVYIAHPYWCGFTVAELQDVSDIPGVVGVEVCNTSCSCIGKDDSSCIIDGLLDYDHRLNIIAVDDSHMPKEFGRNWTAIIAPDNSRESLVAALRQGQAYASQGPQFHKISYQNGIFEAEFSPCTEALVIGERGSGRNCSGDLDPYGDETITSIRLDCTGIRWKKYLRCRIRDTRGRFAWTNPFWIGG